MRELLKVIEISMTDAHRAEELLEKGARAKIARDPERFLAKFDLWRSLGRVRVVREIPRRGFTRSNAA